MFCAYKLMSLTANLVTVLFNIFFTIFWILISSGELMLYGSFSESLADSVISRETVIQFKFPIKS